MTTVTGAPAGFTTATSADPDPVAAAAALVRQLGRQDALYLVFVTAGYPRAELAAALTATWGDRVIGCSSAGNIGEDGFSPDPVLVIAFRGRDLVARTVMIEPLSDLSAAIDRIRPELEPLIRERVTGGPPGRESFGLLLVDGLSMMEEHLAASLRPLLGDIPLIGGSAGDDLSFTETGVLHGGRFAPDRATLTIVSTATPFQVFRFHHYTPQLTILVITSASPARRLVHEINGVPAAQAFAEAIGVTVAELGPGHFSANPVLLKAAGEYWVRSISRAFPDGSLQFFAAIDLGAVLRLGRPGDAEGLLRERLTGVREQLGGSITGMLVCDCVLRRVEFIGSGRDRAIGRVLSEHRAAGFSTYGEQFDDFHMNQTMVGVAFGAAGPVGD